ncbi:MAG: ATP-binding cassette domain-containing protein [Myxococcota bacterium]|nr:ATP-binding cassette domain-containing protein [Myxococcota bacterium]
MISAQNLGVGKVLSDVTFSLPAEGCLGVVGLNGAGKSTLLALLAGVIRRDHGSLTVPPGAAYLPEACPLDPGVSVRSWLRLARGLPGFDSGLAKELEEALPLPEKTAAGRLSQGQRVRLGLRMTLCRRAPAWILDDPFLGLDPVATRVAESVIASRCSDGPVVVAAQDTGIVERLCTHLLLLRDGRPFWFAALQDWRDRFRSVRVPGAQRAAVESLGSPLLACKTRGSTLELLLDDPGGRVEEGLDARPLPLSLSDLLVEIAR